MLVTLRSERVKVMVPDLLSGVVILVDISKIYGVI